MLAYRVPILGYDWTVWLLTETQFKRRYPPENGAFTYAVAEEDGRGIYLRRRALTKTTIKHELTHAYFWECCVGAACLSKQQLIEVHCELVARHGKRIDDQADEILQAFKILKSRKR